MIPAWRGLLFRLLGVLLLVVVTTAPVVGAPAYKVTFDTDRQQGALAQVDTPAWLSTPPKDSTNWYRTSSTFDLAVQKILGMHGVVGALPATGSLPDRGRYLIIVGIVGIISGRLVLWRYARRHQHGAG
jgi:hypothetical protein